MKRAWAALLVTLAAVLPARLYAAFKLVDPQTGFYTDNGKFAVICAAVTVLGIVLTALFSRRRAAELRNAPLRNVPAAAFAALAAMFVAGNSLVSLAASDGFNVLNIILMVSGVCAAVALLMATYDFSSGETVLRHHPLAALLVPVWGCLCLVSLFVTYGATVNRFESVYHTCTVALMLLFLFSQSKLLAGVEEKDGSRVVFGYGFAAVIFALTDAVPNIATLFAGGGASGSSSGFLTLLSSGSETTAFPAGMYFVECALAVYAVAWIAAEDNRRTSARMVSIGLHLSDDAAAEQGAPILPDDTKKLESQEGGTDAMQPYLDFLQKVYPGEHKFVEKGKHEFSAPESAKS